MEYQKLALLVGLSGWFFGIYGLLRNSKSDSAEDAKTIAQISAKLDVVTVSLTEIKTRLDVSDRDDREVLERIAVLEQSVKSAHHRIDTLENKKQ